MTALRGKLKYDPINAAWRASLWTRTTDLADERELYFGSKFFPDWAEALQWLLWRVGLSPHRG